MYFNRLIWRLVAGQQPTLQGMTFTHVRDCRGKPDPKGNAPTIIRKHELTVITYFLKVIRIMALFRNFETSNEHGYE